MLDNKTIAVVIPAFNEEKNIADVIETMPDFVDRIVIVNDNSGDNTESVVGSIVKNDNADYSSPRIQEKEIVRNKFNYAEVLTQEVDKKEKQNLTPSEIFNTDIYTSRIILINHKKNAGVGAAVATGYQWCKANHIDCIAKIDGDGQMDPAELKKICLPIINEQADYVKGNRLIHRNSKLVIPPIRYFGNSVLSIMTKIASGYWSVSDTQTAFTAISRTGLLSIRLDKLYKKYGYPNDILVKLNIASCIVQEEEIKPVYNVGEQSKMKIFKLIPRISLLLFKSFFKRLFFKYFFRDFHPLFLFYMLSFILGIINIPYLFELLKNYFIKGQVTQDNWLIVFMFLTITSLQSLLFAMWMDIQDNQRLYKHK